MLFGERSLTLADLEKLCAAFLELPGMRERSTRDLYIDALNGQLHNALSVRRYLDPNHDVWSLVRSCQDYPGGIRRLAAIVRAFHRGSRSMTDLDEMIEYLYPDEFLEPAEREELVELLTGIDDRFLAVAFRHAVPPSWMTGAFDWRETTWIVQRLESCVGAVGVPPLLVFVDFLAHQVDAVRSAEQHRWIDKVGVRHDMDFSSLRDLCVAATARLDEAQRFYFIVQLQPDGLDPDSYLLSVWLQHHHAVEEPLHRDDTPLTLAEIMVRLPDLVNQAHTAFGIGSETGDLTLEFILPRSLIGHSIDQWEVDEIFPHRLGTSYPLVVRSLDRMRSRQLHGSWRRKWRWLSTNGHRDEPRSVLWLSDPGSRAPHALHAGLLRVESSVALAMAFPPRDSASLGLDELTAALYAGVPIILWCRERALRHQFEEEIRAQLTGRGLVELPALILRLRQEADEEDPGESPLGQHLTLLWDDADRIPKSLTRESPLQAPKPQ